MRLAQPGPVASTRPAPHRQCPTRAALPTASFLTSLCAQTSHRLFVLLPCQAQSRIRRVQRNAKTFRDFWHAMPLYLVQQQHRASLERHARQGKLCQLQLLLDDQLLIGGSLGARLLGRDDRQLDAVTRQRAIVRRGVKREAEQPRSERAPAIELG